MGLHMSTGIIFAVAALALSVLIVKLGIIRVNQGYEGIVERWGRYNSKLEPGLNFIVPFMDQVVKMVNKKELVMEIPSMNAITSDNVTLQLNAVIFYTVIDSAKATYEVNNIELALHTLSTTTLRSEAGSLVLDNLLSNREKLNISLMQTLSDAGQTWGIIVNRVEVQDIVLPKDMINAMSQQLKADRLKRATILESEGTRASDILEAEGKQKSIILVAEAEKKSLILASEAEKQQAFLQAEARERTAQAEAISTEMVSKAITEGNPLAINYFLGLKYISALDNIGKSGNSKMIMLPLDATSVMGSLAGIAEVAKGIIQSPSNKD